AGGTASALVITDGQTGVSPVWNTSVNMYDALGMKHQIVFKFQRALPSTVAGYPGPQATGAWKWYATENGVPLADYTSTYAAPTPNNAALFFDNTGKLLTTTKQTI